MTRRQVEHALRAAADVTGRAEFFVIGSQAIHGQFPDVPVDILKRSREVDLYNVDYDPEFDNEIAGILGFGSPFDETHGFYVDSVDSATAILPDGWRERVHVIEGENTVSSARKIRARGLCLDVVDLLVSKYAAFREKDFAFARAAIVSGHVDEVLLRNAIEQVEERIGARRLQVALRHIDDSFREYEKTHR